MEVNGMGDENATHCPFCEAGILDESPSGWHLMCRMCGKIVILSTNVADPSPGDDVKKLQSASNHARKLRVSNLPPDARAAQHEN